MKILVTGCNGFIGTHLCTRLRKEHDVFYLARPHNPTQQPGASGETFFFENNNIGALSQYMRDNQIEGIIHLASCYIQAHKEEDIQNLIQSNVYFGTAVLEAAAKADVKWFINTGTIWQNYNAPDGSDAYCPVNLYAATKQAFMDIAKFYSETTNMRICTLKLCDTYGPNDTRRKIYSLFEKIAHTGETLQMSAGEQKLDILQVDDVVEGFAHLAEMMHNGKELRDEYVLTSGQQLTLREIAARYEKEHNVHLKIEWGARPYRVREVMTPYKGNVLPGWKPNNERK